MALHGYLEPLCEHASILRLGPQCYAFPDPYEWSVVIVHESADVGLVKGLAGTFQREHWEGIQDVLHAAGIRWARFVRMKRGRQLIKNVLTQRKRQQQQGDKHMKVITSVVVQHDNGAGFSSTVNQNEALEQAEAVELRDALVAKINEDYKEIAAAAAAEKAGK